MLDGGDGNDTLVPGAGVDYVDGGPGDDTIMLLDPCELTPGKVITGGAGNDTLVLPPTLSVEALADAGVSVWSDVEAIVVSHDLETFAAACAED